MHFSTKNSDGAWRANAAVTRHARLGARFYLLIVAVQWFEPGIVAQNTVMGYPDTAELPVFVEIVDAKLVDRHIIAYFHGDSVTIIFFYAMEFGLKLHDHVFVVAQEYAKVEKLS